MTKEDKIILKTILKELKNQAPLSINDIFNKIKNIKQVKKHFPDLDVVEVIKYLTFL